MEIYILCIIGSFLSRKYGFGQIIPKIRYFGYRDPNFSYLEHLKWPIDVTLQTEKQANNVLNMLIPNKSVEIC